MRLVTRQHREAYRSHSRKERNFSFAESLEEKARIHQDDFYGLIRIGIIGGRQPVGVAREMRDRRERHHGVVIIPAP